MEIIGEEIRQRCLKALGKEAKITIDRPSRVALSIEATESSFREAISNIEGWKVSVSEILELPGWIAVELAPLQPPEPRDLAAEIDEIKARIDAIGILRKT